MMDKEFMRIMKSISRDLSGIHDELKKANNKKPLIVEDADERIEDTVKRWIAQDKVVVKKLSKERKRW